MEIKDKILCDTQASGVDSIDLLKSSYYYDLPDELVARTSLERRDHSRFLVYLREEDKIIHAQFKDLPELLPASAHLVLNNSEVFPCRLHASKASGGKAEIFVLSLVPESVEAHQVYKVFLKASGKRRVGEIFSLPGEVKGKVITAWDQANGSAIYGMEFTGDGFRPQDFLSYLKQHALVPLPPYMKREAHKGDRSRYQTVYASSSQVGSTAAPTAGLHFTEGLFEQLLEKGIDKSFVTLHVGPGTFLPVKEENILAHKMHSEQFMVSSSTLSDMKEHQGDLIAVGTTSLRVLESVREQGASFAPDQFFETDIFIYPGKAPRSIRGLITNFHLPESTLMMLVSALIGRKKLLELYDVAIREKYRFFSYGDAMLIL